ncbi:DUF6113 family protein [Streptomyces somaliensis]|uniref:DUF6113 family protein n=1 Tax=Streptomyces somaliensis TaxID=78355 RepID=UPI0020CFE665|nr:DUF6113 family protein [Streptomyces somaliensis]MCP9944713.1 DUF6113 family protein [Streptomyces somaliensis]MCP9962062.1 DUF6113 family protein [Streptomyces somaliensis]MCP9974882.1 DUF6113 family protein [Streptomyces somaliensis]
MSAAVKVLVHALLALLGVLVGLAGALVQAGWLPGGLLLALLATGALFYGGRRAVEGQSGVVSSGAGWLVAVAAAGLGRGEGDKLLWGGLADLVFVFGGVMLAVMCATLFAPPQQR